MLKSVIKNNGLVKICGGCSEARGITEIPLIEKVKISNMKEFSHWVIDSEKILTFYHI